MQRISAKEETYKKTREAVLVTLAFFNLYEIPVKKERLAQLVYKHQVNKDEFDVTLKQLVEENLVQQQGDWFGLKPWDEFRFFQNQIEIAKRFDKVKKYFWLLSILPFVEHISVINSLVMGNAHEESDIDFFVITRPNRMYFVRSLIIAIFKALRLYKTKNQIKDRFCFGFYVDAINLDLSPVLLEDEDPLFAFWFASFGPLFNRKFYNQFVDQNVWIKNYFPNFSPQSRFEYYQFQPFWHRAAKRILEIVFWLPAAVLEPVLARIHIAHTFNLPENHWPTSTTVATRHMLKLHALDPRREIRDRFLKALQSWR